MNGLPGLLALVGPMSLIVALLVTALLSQRLSLALPHQKRYRWLLVSLGVATLGFSLRLLGLFGLLGSDIALLTYTMVTAVALTIAVPVAWGYWGWLLGEGQRAGKSGQHRDVQ